MESIKGIINVQNIPMCYVILHIIYIDIRHGFACLYTDLDVYEGSGFEV